MNGDYFVAGLSLNEGDLLGDPWIAKFEYGVASVFSTYYGDFEVPESNGQQSVRPDFSQGTLLEFDGFEDGYNGGVGGQFGQAFSENEW